MWGVNITKKGVAGWTNYRTSRYAKSELLQILKWNLNLYENRNFPAAHDIIMTSHCWNIVVALTSNYDTFRLHFNVAPGGLCLWFLWGWRLAVPNILQSNYRVQHKFVKLTILKASAWLKGLYSWVWITGSSVQILLGARLTAPKWRLQGTFHNPHPIILM